MTLLLIRELVDPSCWNGIDMQYLGKLLTNINMLRAIYSLTKHPAFILECLNNKKAHVIASQRSTEDCAGYSAMDNPQQQTPTI